MVHHLIHLGRGSLHEGVHVSTHLTAAKKILRNGSEIVAGGKDDVDCICEEAGGIFLAQDGTPWAKIEEVNGEGGGWLGLCPVLIPFDKLEKTDKTYGLKILK